MTYRTKTGLRCLLAAGAMAIAAAMPMKAQAETTYNLAMLSDFSGPYADIMPVLAGGREAVFTWWNATRGKELGVKLNFKNYETRYDAAQVASLWPGIKSELDPIAVVGLGGPDVAALSERLPEDKIPMFMATAAYGFAWQPDSWIFNPRPTYSHESAGFLAWLRAKRGGDEPIKVAILASEASPAYVDMAKGLELYAKQHPEEIDLVEVIYTEVQPTDLTAQMRRVARAGAEALIIQTNTSIVVAAKRGLQANGADIPIMMSSHNGLPASGRALGGLEQLEGDFEAYGMAIAAEQDTLARQFYQSLVSDYGLKAPWNVVTAMGISQGLFTVTVIEHAIEENGAEGLTGAKVREALFAKPITTEETHGFLPSLTFTPDAPFPLKGLKVNVGTVKDGKITIEATGVDVPDVQKGLIERGAAVAAPVLILSLGHNHHAGTQQRRSDLFRCHPGAQRRVHDSGRRSVCCSAWRQWRRKKHDAQGNFRNAEIRRRNRFRRFDRPERHADSEHGSVECGKERPDSCDGGPTRAASPDL
jgi:branched-chain amino acid transport system substrate-binding protein